MSFDFHKVRGLALVIAFVHRRARKTLPTTFRAIYGWPLLGCALLAYGIAPAANAATGKAFNPDIAANFLGLLEHSSFLPDDRRQVPHNGLSLQEAEVQMSAAVDPYLRASVLLSIAQNPGTTEFGIDPEEIYVETISLPLVTLRAGKFKLAMGKHNQLHTHAFPFIDAPLINTTLLGAEGLNEAGLSAAVLLPLPWYSELTVQGFDPSNEMLFKSRVSGNVGGLAHFKNLWDLSDDLTAELGFSGAIGQNQYQLTSSILGADLTFKWRPSSGGKYRALWWSTEYLYGDREGLTDATSGASLARLGGLATWLQFQFAERWWIQGRYEYVGLPTPAALPVVQKQSALVGFFPSEFSGFRVQYDHLITQGGGTGNGIALQYNVSIGAHPAHAY